MNWKKLLKKNLQITKKNALMFMIKDHNRNSKLMEISDNIKPFNHEDFLIVNTLQGQEKMVGFKECKEYFRTNTECPMEQFILSFFSNNGLYRFIITRYTILNPILGKEENIYPNEIQGYSFNILTPDTQYNSGIVTNLDKNSGKILFENDPLNIFIEDFNGKNIKFKKKGSLFELSSSWTDLTFTLRENRTPKCDPSVHFENVKKIGNYYLIQNENKQKGIIEHEIYNYQTFLFKRLIYNLIHSIKPETRYKEIKIFLFFDNGKNIRLEIKQPTIENEITIKNGIFEKETTLQIIDSQELPTLWKMEHNKKIYYLSQVKLNEIKFPTLENEYIAQIEILTRNESKSIGNGWISYRNFENESKVLHRKIKKLYRPLERPSIETFKNNSFPIYSIVPSIIFIFFIFLLTIIIIITLCFQIHPEISLFQ